jgi:2-polyprenyl-6-methoxyphenol hydroxylase-like FAD-dependent oxidoreductase
MDPIMETTDVAIIGGGPAGLMLAIELGCRDVACVVLEEDIAPPDAPKANATSSRTMEHYRRRGFASEIRALGLAADHPQDVVYCTTLAGRELTRFSIPSRTEALNRTSFGDYGEGSWPTPELPHRGQQMFIEPVLRAQAQKYPSVKLKLGWRAESLAINEQQVSITTHHVVSGETVGLNARYVIGCDGPRSLVRKTCGIRYSGQSDEVREFFGGQMLSVYFKSPSLYRVLGKQRAWQYWAVNAVQRGLLIAIDGVDQFLFCLQMQPGEKAESVDFRAAMFAAIGQEFDFDLINAGPWQAGFTLVADHFSKGRAFLAGDAAHLFTPTGGMGYNTSVDDAVNLGWKLAAVVKGWAAEGLLDSYEAERKPIAHRNTTFARAMADSIGSIKVPANVDADGPEAERIRQQLGAALAQHVRNEFNIPGLQLGLRYEGSPTVAEDAQPPTADEPNHYVPNARPGARAPHIWINDQSIFDLFSRDFTLLCFTGSAHAGSKHWQRIATVMGVPLEVMFCDNREAQTLYGAEMVLIRPDHHIAWRGGANSDAEALLAMACALNKQTTRQLSAA